MPVKHTLEPDPVVNLVAKGERSRWMMGRQRVERRHFSVAVLENGEKDLPAK
jgi:hypothetical protein